MTNKLKPAFYLASLFLFLLVLFLPLLTQAATELTNPLTGGTTGNLEDVVKNAITGALGLSGVLALIAFIYGGITWMTSGGESAKVQKGRNMMVWAVWGLVIIFSSYAILTYIFGALLGGGQANRVGSGSDTSVTIPPPGNQWTAEDF